MAKALSALLLVVALLVCPFMCRADACGCCANLADISQNAGCCPHGCCTQDEEPIGPASPAPASPDDPCPNDCICEGALAGGEPQAFDLEFQAGLIVDVAPVDVASPTCSVDSVYPSGADGLKSGSALRIACCSWLC